MRRNQKNSNSKKEIERKNRSLKRIKKTNKNIIVFIKNNKLFVKGPLGVVDSKIKMNNISSLKQNRIFFTTKKLNKTIAQIKQLYKHCSVGFFVELHLKGIGYKCFKYNNKIALDLGYSNLILFIPNSDIKYRIIKNRILFFSIHKDKLYNLVNFLKKLAPLDRYKGKGLFIKNEKIKLKQKKNI